MTEFHPEVVFHLAAQPLVRRSYADPLGTYATNVMGTAHVLEAVRKTPSVRAVVCVTTDKCYQNHEWIWPYRETDPLGGYDPYSSSKACAEIVSAAYRNSFFPVDRKQRALGCNRNRTRRKCDWWGRLVGGSADSRPHPWISDRTASSYPATNVDSSVAARAGATPWLHHAGRGVACGADTICFFFQLWTSGRGCLACGTSRDPSCRLVGGRSLVEARRRSRGA